MVLREKINGRIRPYHDKELQVSCHIKRMAWQAAFSQKHAHLLALPRLLFLSPLQWCDGSMQRDLPLAELSEQFGCSTETNQHAAAVRSQIRV